VRAPEPEPAPSSAPRREYVRPSQRAAAPAVPEQAAPAAAAPAADDWPETVRPGSAAPAPVPAPAEPDVPLPPEPTDEEDWPHPAAPAAAESSPAPRGGEPVPVVSANPEPAKDGELTTADVRRMWPELLAVVKRHKRTTEALLKNAQVHELKNGVLTLSTSSPALSRRIGDDLNKDVLREALNELLGVRWRVEAVVEGAGGPPAAGRQAPSPEAPRQAAAADAAEEEREIMAQRAAEAAAGVRVDDAPPVDPEQAALSLLRAHLGARPIDS
jgi:DNA polymerase-3 subunit gamma/tau